MKKTNRKGFTIVELVIVIAVIAILAGVLIPTFASVVRKANISSDTIVAKNLNTAVSSTQAKNFDEAYAAARDFGYLVANLNAKTDGCYFVWEDDTKQFLLYDLKAKKIIYSNTEVTGDPDDSWFFAVNNTKDEAAVKAVWPNAVAKMLLASISDIADVLAAGGTIYIDESLTLDKDNLLVLDNADKTTTIMLGNSSLNTSGIIDDVVPIQIKSGTVELVGGTIGAAGAYIDDDGNLVNSPLEAVEGTTTTIDGTTFNINANGYITLFGDATVKNATFNSQGVSIYCGNNGQVVLENTTVNSTARCVWVTNWNGVNHTDGTATITIESGSYKGGNATYSAISVYSGDVVINGGDFTSNEGIDHLFYVMHTGSITISGGTFNGTAFADMEASDFAALCFNSAHKVVENGDGSITITKK